MHSTDELSYTPQPRQELLHKTTARQILYGGAVGGGKSHALRWDAYIFCLQNPGCQAYLFRRSLVELRDNHIKFVRSEIPASVADYSETRNALEFKNGSTFNFCYCEKESDVYRYQGSEMHWCGIDEAGQMTPTQLNYLKTRNRLGGWKPSDDHSRERLPRFVMGSNPGGPGHNYLKSIFKTGIEPEKYFQDMEMVDPNNPDDPGWKSVFIPAAMADNKFIDANYAGALGGLPPELAKAYREGDWDAVVGQALHLLSEKEHKLRPFVPPKHWTRFMVIDWGSVSPFSVGWYAVSEGALLKAKGKYPDRWIPTGALVRYAEWYGWNGKPNQGCRNSAPVVARGIIEREEDRNDTMDYRIGDTEMWAQRGGPSVAEWFLNTDGRLILRKSQKDRKRNYSEVLARLSGSPNHLEDGSVSEDPMFFITADCAHFWRTCSSLVLDEVDPEKGPDTKLEDHVYDEVAYALRSRPFVTTEADRFEAEWGEEMRQSRGGLADAYATR